MKEPKVSVLLCVYNPDKSQLKEAVESIINQTFQDWEMILYDDGSEEIYAEYICDIAKLDDRIKYVKSEHCNLAHGLNVSVAMAKGQYVARMDADDISHKDRLRIMCEFLDNNQEYSWVGSNISLINNEGNIWGNRHYPQIVESKDFLRYSPYAHPTIVFRRKVLLDNNYIESKKSLRGEDYELFMRLHSKGYKGYNLQKFLLYYRETRESYRKRKLYFQLQEVIIRYKGFKKLGLLSFGNFKYVIKPLVVWSIPNRALIMMKHSRQIKAYDINQAEQEASATEIK